VPTPVNGRIFLLPCLIGEILRRIIVPEMVQADGGAIGLNCQPRSPHQVTEGSHVDFINPITMLSGPKVNEPDRTCSAKEVGRQ
jgi:hypothetical protein